jgi:hypothetical protein
MVSLVDRNKEWALAIGRAFVAFGAIEHATIACLRTIPRNRIQKSTQMFRLAQRVDLLLEILETREGDGFLQLSLCLSRVKELAKMRNIVAHNPLVLDFSIPDYSRGMAFTEVIAVTHREGLLISLESVQRFAEESEKLASEIHGANAKVFAALREQRSAN